MPRKKSKPAEVTSHEPVGGATAVAEPEPQAANRPAYIDGPPVHTDGSIVRDGEDRPKNWGDPYKSIVTNQAFEMGENRRFKQRVFKFSEKPADDVIAALKDNGFTYRPTEKAWTIQADADTRKLSDELARQFRGPGHGMER
jgi:hypothetical protein